MQTGDHIDEACSSRVSSLGDFRHKVTMTALPSFCLYFGKYIPSPQSCLRLFQPMAVFQRINLASWHLKLPSETFSLESSDEHSRHYRPKGKPMILFGKRHSTECSSSLSSLKLSVHAVFEVNSSLSICTSRLCSQNSPKQPQHDYRINSKSWTNWCINCAKQPLGQPQTAQNKLQDFRRWAFNYDPQTNRSYLRSCFWGPISNPLLQVK